MDSIAEEIQEIDLNKDKNENNLETPDARTWINFGNRSTPSGSAYGVLNIHEDSIDYDMKHLKRGKCVILNHENFSDPTQCPQRKGTKADADALYGCFRDLGFDVETCNDFTTKKIVNTFSNIAKQDHSDSDCFVCCILTHGETGYLWSQNDRYIIDMIISFFTGDKCQSLAGKPKIFIIQACRGFELDDGVSLKVRDVTDSGHKTIKIPVYADFLIAYSTMSGFYSWRNPSHGSWFVNHLTSILNQYSKQLDLLSMLTVVNQRIAYHKQSNNNVEQMHNKKQVPCITHTLTRRIFFTPKDNDI